MYAVSMLKNGRLFRKRKKLWQSLSVWPALFWNPTILPIRPYLYLITELSKNPLSASFLGSHLVEAYLNASSGLLVSDREAELKKAVRELSPNSL